MCISHKFYFTKSAINDLIKIQKYLDGYDPSIFVFWYRELIYKISLLVTHPKIYNVIACKSSVEYRRFFVRNYAVIYDIDDELNMIKIDRIYYCKENYLSRIYQL